MKKNLLLGLAVISGVTIFFIGCKKNDTSGPDIRLNGTNPMTVSLNSTSPDPGATANDDQDASVLVTTAGTLDVNTKGDYTITYSATDKAGNNSTVTRLFHVVNDAEPWAHNYHVSDSVLGITMNQYDEVITTDNHINNRIHFNLFDNYSSNSGIYGTVVTADSVSIPFQTAVGIGWLVQTHSFTSAGSLKTGNNFWLTYHDVNNTTMIAVMDSAVFVKY